MPPVHVGFRTRRSRTWRLPLGDGRVPCPVDGVCGVEQCLVCPDFVGYVDGAVICHHTLGPVLAVAVALSEGKARSWLSARARSSQRRH